MSSIQESSTVTSIDDKVKARKKLNHAIEDGKITRQPCRKCGAPKAQAHHHDYGKPLDVEWLCPLCHSQLHNQKYPITKECAVCGITFTPHKTKRARAVTCSRACFARRLHLIHSRLTVEQMVEIRNRFFAGGITQAELAREFGCDRGRVGQIIRGKASRIPAINELLSRLPHTAKAPAMEAVA